MDKYVVIDIGGTAIKYGVANSQGELLLKKSCPSPALDGGAAIVQRVIEIVGELRAEFDAINGVAIDTAGIVAPGDDGEVVFAGERSFPGYSGTRLGALVREATGLPVTVENDVNAAALGEYWLGAARGASSAFVMTVGTGIGGALVIDGRVFHGASYSAGEAGFMRVHGTAQIFEELASTRALIADVAAEKNISPAELDGKMIFDWYREGDSDAVEAVERWADNLAEGLATIMALLNPAVIVLGGGVMAQGEVIRPLLTERLAALVPAAMRVNTRLEFATLGNDAGMLGALFAHIGPSTFA